MGYQRQITYIWLLSEGARNQETSLAGERAAGKPVVSLLLHANNLVADVPQTCVTEWGECNLLRGRLGAYIWTVVAGRSAGGSRA
jgi:hypothetical protein